MCVRVVFTVHLKLDLCQFEVGLPMALVRNERAYLDESSLQSFSSSSFL